MPARRELTPEQRDQLQRERFIRLASELVVQQYKRVEAERAPKSDEEITS